MGNETPITSVVRQILLVASPNDTHTSELITAALRASGVSVLVADTILQHYQSLAVTGGRDNGNL